MMVLPQQGVPAVQYSHVSSSVSAKTTASILLGQLHRYRELIMVRSYYVLECALLLHRMINRGYHHRVLFARLKRHLQLYPDTYMDGHFLRLFADIHAKFHDPRLPALCSDGVGVDLQPYL